MLGPDAMDAILQELLHAAQITSLVFVMMAVVELVSVLTHGRLGGLLAGRPHRQYLLASFLGATPGCAGVYLVDSIYSRGAISLGAVTAALVATAGDEAFLMLAMMPREALLLMAGLFLVGIAGGWATDRVLAWLGHAGKEPCALVDLHEEDLPTAPSLHRWLPLRIHLRPAVPRLVVAAVLLALLLLLASGFTVHHHDLHMAGGDSPHAGAAEGWIFGAVALLGLALTLLAPAHWMEEHLWHHLALHHIPRIFAWTAGALVGVQLLLGRWNLAPLLEGHGAWVLLGAALLGLIPISGPHLVVLTLFLSGHVPLSVLVANSIVQDGHGLLPLLGISVQDALVAKAANLVIGLLAGYALLAVGL